MTKEVINQHALRATIRKQRLTLSAAEQQSAAHLIVEKLSAHPTFLASQHIAVYMPCKGEVDPIPLLKLIWSAGKTCYLPIVASTRQLHFVIYQADDRLTLNRYKILEPPLVSHKIISPAQLDLVLLPLVAFDTQGNRLGMGAGYYDHTFAFLNHTPRPPKPYLMGLAYELQKTAELAHKSWDVRLNGVVTEKNVYEF